MNKELIDREVLFLNEFQRRPLITEGLNHALQRGIVILLVLMYIRAADYLNLLLK